MGSETAVGSSEYLPYDFSMNVGETKVASGIAKGQFLVIESQEVQ